MTTSTRKDRHAKYISASEAARILGISRQTVSNLIRQGCFTTYIAAGRVLLLRSEIETYSPRHKGRPTKGSTAIGTRQKPRRAFNKRLEKGLVSQAEAARIRGVSQQAISNLIQRGRLASVVLAGRTLVFKSEVEAFKSHTKERSQATGTTRKKSP